MLHILRDVVDYLGVVASFLFRDDKIAAVDRNSLQDHQPGQST